MTTFSDKPMFSGENQRYLQKEYTNFQEEANNFHGAEFDTRDKLVERSAAWLGREIQTLLASNTNMSQRVLLTIFDDLSGDLTLKAFQLQTLEKISSRYLNDHGFQWFINSTFTSMAASVMFNPCLLTVHPFRRLEGAQRHEPVIGLNEREQMALSTVELSESGFTYLLRRPWLAMYLLAIRQYKQANSLDWLLGEIRKIEISDDNLDPLKDPKGPIPDPDSVSTDIPYPEWTIPPLNNLGA